MRFLVKVTMLRRLNGSVVVEAKTRREALEKADKDISTGALQTAKPAWQDPEYEDFSFETIGEAAPMGKDGEADEDCCQECGSALASRMVENAADPEDKSLTEERYCPHCGKE